MARIFLRTIWELLVLTPRDTVFSPYSSFLSRGDLPIFWAQKHEKRQEYSCEPSGSYSFDSAKFLRFSSPSRGGLPDFVCRNTRNIAGVIFANHLGVTRFDSAKTTFANHLGATRFGETESAKKKLITSGTNPDGRPTDRPAGRAAVIPTAFKFPSRPKEPSSPRSHY